MAHSVFVDTWGWYALIDRRDPEHGRTAALVRRTSFAVMRERRIRQAVTRDEHFRIAGFEPLPEHSSRRR